MSKKNVAVSTEDIQKTITQISGCSECDVDERLQCNPEYQILDDNEIIQSVTLNLSRWNNEDEDDDNVASAEPEKDPTASEAFACFDTVLKWMERQPECDHMHLPAVKRLRNLAAGKRVPTSKQVQLKNHIYVYYFKYFVVKVNFLQNTCDLVFIKILYSRNKNKQK